MDERPKATFEALSHPEGCPGLLAFLEGVDDQVAQEPAKRDGVFARWRLRRRVRRERYERHREYEHAILERLSERGKFDAKAFSASERDVAELIANTVSLEKGVSPPALHPDDPIDMLFFGAFDDLSPLRFRMLLEERLGIELDTEQFAEMVLSESSVREVIWFCLRFAPAG